MYFTYKKRAFAVIINFHVIVLAAHIVDNLFEVFADINTALLLLTHFI